MLKVNFEKVKEKVWEVIKGYIHGDDETVIQFLKTNMQTAEWMDVRAKAVTLVDQGMFAKSIEKKRMELCEILNDVENRINKTSDNFVYYLYRHIFADVICWKLGIRNGKC